MFQKLRSLVFVASLFFLLTISFSPIAAQDDNQIQEIARLGRGTANSLAWRPDGEVLAVGSGTGIWFYDENFETLGYLDQESIQGISELSWSPDGQKLMFIGCDPLCHTTIWDVDAATYEGTLLLDIDEPREVAWHPDSEHIVFAQSQPFDPEATTSLSVLNITTQAETLHILNSGDAAIAWSFDGTKIATADREVVHIWDAATSAELSTFQASLAQFLTWSLDGTTLSGTCNKPNAENEFSTHLCFWDATTGAEIRSFRLIERATINALQWNADRSRIIVVIGRNGLSDLLYVWNPESGERLEAFSVQGYSLQASWRDNAVITITSDDGQITHWSVDTKAMIASARLFTSSIRSLAWSPDGTQLAASGVGVNQPVFIWDYPADDQYVAAQVFTPTLVDHVAWLPDNRTVVTVGSLVGDTSWIYEVSSWDSVIGLATDDVSVRLGDQASAFPIVGWNSDFSRIAESHNGDFYFNIDDLELSASAHMIVWSPDDRYVVTASRMPEATSENIQIWDSETGALVVTIPFPDLIRQIQWSPDLQKLAVTSGSFDVYIYDVTTGEMLLNIPAEGGGQPLVWSPDSQLIAITPGGGVYFFAIADGSVVAVMGGQVLPMAWHPNGDVFAAGASDGTIRIWDISALTEGN